MVEPNLGYVLLRVQTVIVELAHICRAIHAKRSSYCIMAPPIIVLSVLTCVVHLYAPPYGVHADNTRHQVLTVRSTVNM